MQTIGVSQVNEQWETYVHLTDSYIAKVNYEREKGTFTQEVFDMFETAFTSLMKSCKVHQIIGANAFLETMEYHSDYGVCFATGSLREAVQLKLKAAEVVFDESVLQTSDYLHMTREAIVLKAIEKAKQKYKVSDFEQIIAFGDGVWDVKTARNLKIDFIGVGKHNEAQLREVGSTKHIEDFTKITAAFLH